MPSKLFLPLLFLLLAAACSSTQPPPDEPLPPGTDRQAELTGLFDLFSGEEVSARKAAAEAARGNSRDRQFLASLWGTRSSEPAAAWRYADALSQAKLNEEAFVWYQRTFMVLAAGDSRRPYVRYEMAKELLAVGNAQDAINLLANRLDPEPLPDDLRAKYDTLLDAAARASR